MEKLKIISSNKRERTITIQKTYDDGTKVVYKSVTLARDEYHYYTNHATENDIRQFLKSDDYYIKK